MAEKTFVYQRVFHRSTTTGQPRMVTLTPCTSTPGVEEEECIGPLLPDDLIEGISRGEIDPITKEPIADLVPTSPPRLSRSNSMAATTKASKAAVKSGWIRETQSAGQKTLDTFFSKSRTIEQRSQSMTVNARKPLQPMTDNALLSGIISAEATSITAVEKSKYFAASNNIVESSPIHTQSGFDHHLASFTPTQSKRTLTRCLSTDSGEISSPASSAVKKTKEKLNSSPLIDDFDASSPNTSPTNIRPRKSESPCKESPESGIEEEIGLQSLEGSLLERFAFQSNQTTPLISTRTSALLKRPAESVARGSSTSSGKRRLTALLHFHNEDDDDVFGHSNDQTPTIKRSHSDTPTLINSNDRPFSIKRINTTSK